MFLYLILYFISFIISLGFMIARLKVKTVPLKGMSQYTTFRKRKLASLKKDAIAVCVIASIIPIISTMLIYIFTGFGKDGWQLLD